MTNQIKVTTEIPQSNGTTIKQDFLIDFDPNKSSEFGFKYLSPADGGPVLRPSKPPK